MLTPHPGPPAGAGVRHFDVLGDARRERLFAVPPQRVERDADPARLALALGATIYSPGTRPSLAADARRAAAVGATSAVWCLEDAVPHEAVRAAEANLVTALRQLPDGQRLPLLFVRVREPEQVVALTRRAGAGARHLTGFVLPKFTAGSAGEAYLSAVEQAGALAGRRLYAMPVLEHPHLAWRETRAEHLADVRALLDARREQVLAVRVGGTDLCGLFGLRRDRDTTIWDVAVVRDALADVVNTFARRGDYVVSGPVWEHVPGTDRLLASSLRSTALAQHRGPRGAPVRTDADELLREVALDRANGLCGKTVIHPSHVPVVNALQTVRRDEYDDALAVLAGGAAGGVVPSPSGGRMNEVGPHTLWAQQLVARAAVYGVLAEPDGVVALLDAGCCALDRVYGRRAPVPVR